MPVELGGVVCGRCRVDCGRRGAAPIAAVRNRARSQCRYIARAFGDQKGQYQKVKQEKLTNIGIKDLLLKK